MCQRRDDVAHDTDERRDRVSRYAEDGLALWSHPEPHRHPRTLRDLIEDLRDAERLEHLRHEVELSLRDTAAEHQHVLAGEVLRQAPLQHPFVIWDVIVGNVLKTAPTQTRKYRIGVGAADLVCGDWLAGFYELIAGGDDHAARLSAYRNARESGRGDHRELRCAQHSAGP